MNYLDLENDLFWTSLVIIRGKSVANFSGLLLLCVERLILTIVTVLLRQSKCFRQIKELR